MLRNQFSYEQRESHETHGLRRATANQEMHQSAVVRQEAIDEMLAGKDPGCDLQGRVHT